MYILITILEIAQLYPKLIFFRKCIKVQLYRVYRHCLLAY